MKKYETVNEKRVFKVKEKKTGFIIKKFNTKALADKFTKLLNNGTGFAGETPVFFVYKKDQ